MNWSPRLSLCDRASVLKVPKLGICYIYTSVAACCRGTHARTTPCRTSRGLRAAPVCHCCTLNHPSCTYGFSWADAYRCVYHARWGHDCLLPLCCLPDSLCHRSEAAHRLVTKLESCFAQQGKGMLGAMSAHCHCAACLTHSVTVQRLLTGCSASV